MRAWRQTVHAIHPTDLELVRGGDLSSLAGKAASYVSSTFRELDCGSKAMVSGTLASMAVGIAARKLKPWQALTLQPAVGAGTYVGVNELCKAHQHG